MVSNSLAQRMRKLQTKLLSIRLGSGAFVLPKDIKKIHLRFAPKINGGHMGPRYALPNDSHLITYPNMPDRMFWRHELVRLKYHNPAVPMTIDRTAAQTEKALLSVHYTNPDAVQSSSSATSAPAARDSTTKNSTPSEADSTERVETIDMTNFNNTQILDAFVRLTKAYPVEPTAEENEELAVLEEQRLRSAAASKLSAEVRARQKREKELLEQARGDMAASQA
jgi:large subunit ribosomal protein MRP49